MADLSNLTGENNFKRGISYDEIQLDGNKGRFLLRSRDAEQGPDGKYPKVDLGAGAQTSYDPQTGKPVVSSVKPLEIVFLKIRRIISSYDPNIGTRRSSEHNHKNERVVLYGPAKGQKEVGIAADLAEKYSGGKDGLRVQQIVYSYFPETDSVVRVSLKGASLMSKATKRGNLKFYDYLQSFKKDEHMYEYITELTPVLETNPDLNKDYFCVSFARGRKLDPDTQKAVEDKLIAIHEEIEQRDAEFRARLVSAPSETPVSSSDDESNPVEYPESISPDDIPF